MKEIYAAIDSQPIQAQEFKLRVIGKFPTLSVGALRLHFYDWESWDAFCSKIEAFAEEMNEHREAEEDPRDAESEADEWYDQHGDD